MGKFIMNILRVIGLIFVFFLGLFILAWGVAAVIIILVAILAIILLPVILLFLL